MSMKMFAVTKIQIFESNSQLPARWYIFPAGCSPSQRYKFLKAIHNLTIIYCPVEVDVRRHKDTNFWKQFTTPQSGLIGCGKMFAVTKIQIFESNSQLQAQILANPQGCSPSQRYKFLKAIHNRRMPLLPVRRDVRRHKDTNFWKQFTTEKLGKWLTLRCSPSQRYKFLKAIHNTGTFRRTVRRMFAVTKIQIFESNSQQGGVTEVMEVWCSPSQRYKFLKAIHNDVLTRYYSEVDVRRHKDTNFWKQFTTLFCCLGTLP